MTTTTTMMRAITMAPPPSFKTTSTATSFSRSWASFMELKDATGLRPPSPSSNSKRCDPAAFSMTCSSSSSSSSNAAYIPKLEPFSRTKFERAVKDPPLIQKSENDLADYCTTLEGEQSYSCWRAYFELKDLEKECPKEEVERLIIEAGGVKSLVRCVHGIAEIHKKKKELEGAAAAAALAKAADADKERQLRRMPFHIPDGLPKSTDEMEEEEKARMPDSPYTRLLRLKGRYPAWYSPAPDHETD
ncbi:hypothetical protein Ancab_018158 [Ancistrocladus abbreviatus]